MKNLLKFAVLLLAFMLGVYLPAQAAALDDGINFFEKKDWASAAEAFKQAMADNPQDALAICFYLDTYKNKGELLDAITFFEQQVAQKGEQPVYQAQLGMGYWAKASLDKSFYDEALNEFKEALKGEELSLAYTGLGMVYYQKRMMSRAKGYFLKAIKLNPGDIIALERVGEIFMLDEKNPQLALDYFTKITAVNPNYPDAYFYRGSAYEHLNKTDEALNELKKCAELDPQGTLQGYNALVRIADMFFRKADYKNAAEYYNQALKLDPMSRYLKYRLNKCKNPDDGAKTPPAPKKPN
jgi:tetratricopeptide (TPR) repeat protein